MRFYAAGLLLIAALVSMVLSPRSTSAQQVGLTSLSALRNQARPLLIFSATPDDPQLGIQLRTLQEHAAEARERQIVAIALPFQTPSPTTLQFAGTEAAGARRHFHVAPGEFAVILIGKDGGAKLRSSTPISMARLIQTVDAMPMRQDEMRGGR